MITRPTAYLGQGSKWGVQHSHVAAWTAALCHYKPVTAAGSVQLHSAAFCIESEALPLENNHRHWGLNHKHLGIVTVNITVLPVDPCGVMFGDAAGTCQHHFTYLYSQSVQLKQNKTKASRIQHHLHSFLPWGWCRTVFTPSTNTTNSVSRCCSCTALFEVQEEAALQLCLLLAGEGEVSQQTKAITHTHTKKKTQLI